MDDNSAQALHEKRGIGVGSRLKFDIQKLEHHKWKVHRRDTLISGQEKCILSFESPDGRLFKSAKDAEKELQETDLYDLVLKDPPLDAQPSTSSRKPAKDDDDVTFCPPPSKKRHESKESSR